MPVYLTWLEIYVGLPLAVLWIAYPRLVWAHKKTLALGAILSIIIGISWDSLAIATGLWWFPASKVLGIYFFAVPVEEFFFCGGLALMAGTMALILRTHFEKALVNKVKR